MTTDHTAKPLNPIHRLGRTAYRVSCDACEIVYINGLRCHETGCPDAWQDEKRTCPWCGSPFAPTSSDQRFCEDSCAESYNS